MSNQSTLESGHADASRDSENVYVQGEVNRLDLREQLALRASGGI